jgi:hypothetical protein
MGQFSANSLITQGAPVDLVELTLKDCLMRSIGLKPTDDRLVS